MNILLWLLLFFCGLVAVVVTTYFIVIRRWMRKSRCTVLITGTVSSKKNVLRSRGKHLRKLQVPICKYDYNGNTYFAELDYAILNDGGMRSGDKIEFYVNPNNPYEISKIGKIEKIEIVNCLVRNSIVMVGLVVMFLYVNVLYLKEQQTIPSSDSEHKIESYPITNTKDKTEVSANEYTNEYANDFTNDLSTEYLETATDRQEAGITVFLHKDFVYMGSSVQNKKKYHAYYTKDKKRRVFVSVEESKSSKDDEFGSLMIYLYKHFKDLKFINGRNYNGNEYKLYKRNTGKGDAYYVISTDGGRSIVLIYASTGNGENEIEGIMQSMFY